MNKNQRYWHLLHRKELKQIGKPVNSRFGSPENKNKSPKDYRKVLTKTRSTNS